MNALEKRAHLEKIRYLLVMAERFAEEMVNQPTSREDTLSLVARIRMAMDESELMLKAIVSPPGRG